MSQMPGDRGSISMARNNSPESYQNFLDNFGSVDIFTGKPHSPYTGPTQEEFEAEERARLGDDLFFKYYPDAQRDDVSQPNTTGGLGGLGSIFDIMKKQMPAPPTQNRGMGDFRISPIEIQRPDPRLMGNMSFMEFAELPVEERLRIRQEGLKAIENEAIGSQPKMPPQMPDMMQQLQEALKQKQNLEMPQRPPPPMRGDMRKKGLLGGLIEKLEMQAAQRNQQPQMPTRPQPRGRSRRFGLAKPQSRGGMFGRIASSPTRGGSGGILPRASGEPDLEQLRKQIRRGISVRGVGI